MYIENSISKNLKNFVEDFRMYKKPTLNVIFKPQIYIQNKRIQEERIVDLSPTKCV